LVDPARSPNSRFVAPHQVRSRVTTLEEYMVGLGIKR
jgi:hypothetical protein